MSGKPTLYCLLGTTPHLPPVGGDRINEARFLRCFSRHFDIYYNNIPYDPADDTFGAPDVEISPPDKEYDFYYVRGNTEILKKCGHPRVISGLPYDPEAYELADGIILTTQIWQNYLERRDTDEHARDALADWYGQGDIVKPKNIIYLGQAVDPAFERPDPARTDVYRKKFTNGFAVGYFGRIAPTTMPAVAMAGIEQVQASHPDVEFVFGGFVRKPTTAPKGIPVPRIAYEDMPNAVAACGAVLGNEEKDSAFLGSGKIIDAMAAGTPILAKHNPVRVEQLGLDYPLFYSTSDEAARCLMQLIEGGDKYRREIADYLERRLGHYSQAAVGERFYRAWENLTR